MRDLSLTEFADRMMHTTVAVVLFEEALDVTMRTDRTLRRRYLTYLDHAFQEQMARRDAGFEPATRLL